MLNRISRLLPFIAVAFLVSIVIPATSQTATQLQITSSAPQPLPGATTGGNTVDSPEFDSVFAGDDTDSGGDGDSGKIES